MITPCRVEMMGGLRLHSHVGTTDRFRTRKTAELLAYLACFHKRRHPREILIDLLWPENDVDAGRHSLSMALSSLRPLLESTAGGEGSTLLADRHSVGINPNALTTDISDFEDAAGAAFRASDAGERLKALSAAVGLYSGEVLSGFYADWACLEQQRLEEQFLHLLHPLVAELERAGDFEQAIYFANRAIEIDKLREESHRDVMRLYMNAGQPVGALRQYRELERILREELNAAPGTKTRSLLREAQDGQSEQLQDNHSEQGVITQPAIAASRPVSLIRSDLLEPVGGAVPLNSIYYMDRPTDSEFRASIRRRDSIVLIKGARQVGKTSLLARGLQEARKAGSQVMLTHFQVFNSADLDSAESLLRTLAETIAEQLNLESPSANCWDPRRGPSLNFRRYMRSEVIAKLNSHLVWGLDEVDRLFTCPFGNEIFGLFRSWHDERALESDSPWDRLTLAISYSTEAYMFITDVNQSPFNVGTRLALDDFTLDQVSELNRRYGSPLDSPAAVEKFYSVLGGHPYLVRCGLHEMVARSTSLQTLFERAISDDWVFGEHLRRILVLLERNPDLLDVVRSLIHGSPSGNRECFHRLRSAGVLAGEAVEAARFRCPLYSRYLNQHLS